MGRWFFYRRLSSRLIIRVFIMGNGWQSRRSSCRRVFFFILFGNCIILQNLRVRGEYWVSGVSFFQSVLDFGVSGYVDLVSGLQSSGIAVSSVFWLCLVYFVDGGVWNVQFFRVSGLRIFSKVGFFVQGLVVGQDFILVGLFVIKVVGRLGRVFLFWREFLRWFYQCGWVVIGIILG